MDWDTFENAYDGMIGSGGGNIQSTPPLLSRSSTRLPLTCAGAMPFTRPPPDIGVSWERHMIKDEAKDARRHFLATERDKVLNPE